MRFEGVGFFSSALGSSGRKSGLPSSMKVMSERYMPKKGMHGGFTCERASRRLLKLPSCAISTWHSSNTLFFFAGTSCEGVCVCVCVCV
jgi:hypothetical protein